MAIEKILKEFKASGDYWTKRDERDAARGESKSRLRWFEYEQVLAHVNAKLWPSQPSVKRGDGPNLLFKSKLNGQVLKRAISIGCGNGTKEMRLITMGLVEHFDLYEASSGRIEQGHEVAKKLGVEDKVTFHFVEDMGLPNVSDYDLVYWNAALHHMLDTPYAVAWSRHILKDGGFFFMDDYVGSNVFQWSDLCINTMNSILKVLPDRLFVNPENPDKPLPRIIERPDPVRVLRRDPTEAIDCERIIPALKLHFPEAEIYPVGGSVYHKIFMEIGHNLDPDKDSDLIGLFLLMDDQLLARGDYHMCVAIAQKQNRHAIKDENSENNS